MIPESNTNLETLEERLLKQGGAGSKIPGAAPSLQRFETSKTTLLIDRFMTHFIKVGGILIIAAVMGIFVFITCQIFPLFQSAKVQFIKSVQVPKKDYRILGMDEWGKAPFLIDSTGKMSFVDFTGKRTIEEVNPGFSEQKEITTAQYHPEKHSVVIGTRDGFFSIVTIDYGSSRVNQEQIITHETKTDPFLQLGDATAPIYRIDYGESENTRLVVAILETGGKREVRGLTMTKSTSLFGSGEFAMDQVVSLSSPVEGNPEKIIVDPKGESALISNDRGSVSYFTLQGNTLQLLQEFKPFESGISLMEFLLGGVSVVFVDSNGTNTIYSLYRAEGGDIRIFSPIHHLDPLPGPAGAYDYSLRNRAFLVTSGNIASLRYATTGDLRWQESLPFKIRLAILGRKYDSMMFLDTEGKLHLYHLDDPHPESSFKQLFGKVWYEGATEPKYEWQSTGATDDFESKLSIVPLILGSLKGTLYAMIFAVPIALLAAIYTSQFLHPGFRVFVKPTMEIMASLPSVVLGFIAALWLAPLIETRVPSIILLVVLLPLSAALFGAIWNSLPIQVRVRVKPGFEWIVYLPLLLFVSYISWILGPIIEKTFFVVPDPGSGVPVADFRLWWPNATGLPFEQRNSLVVGFMMGFAVIPIIFTIAEDALSNVPGALRSGSLALGASRWQTAMRIVVPTASAGIFSAIMIGLGRAVGETMIVVMATGNTPILDFNIFSGMRTLSANIAVELPEAPHHSTLYRTLFLGGLVLFIMTFIVNTLAEILRQHLREKYKTV